MDKTDKLLDLIDRLEAYTDVEIETILSDPETAHLYSILSAAASASAEMDCRGQIDIDAEWRKFVRHESAGSRKCLWPYTRFRVAAAAVSAIFVSVALAIGITVSLTHRDPVSSGSRQSVPPVSSPQKTPSGSGRIEASPHGGSGTASVVVFENTTLRQIVETIAERYGMKVDFSDAQRADMRLKFDWDSAASLDETIEELNSFEQIDIRVEGEYIRVL